ncbi:MAG: hypothetical protein JSW11_01280 [Candidatus Heimdallarchaeota archaeon]|nr:MAG: hypothetical protein JSW11_01280 [Candidatus Heimdallarchaeota archaeon]
MITIFDRYHAEEGTLEHERKREHAFGPIAEMIEVKSWNLEGFHQKIITAFKFEGTNYTTTFVEFQIDGMGAIIKEVTARLDPKEHANYRAD